MIEFPCQVCQTPLKANDAQAGQLVRCPTCSTTLRVPVPAAAATAASSIARAYVGTGPAPSTFVRGSGRRYGFNCGYCSSRLEATESMAAQEGQCPTCGNQITIPILDRYGRLIDPKTRQIIKQDPHPVHAYAAAGDRAPAILRQKDGTQVIRCPRCPAVSPINSNNCRSCGMPFTMEGTHVESGGASNGYCVASLVLGIIGIPTMCSVILPLLAILFGIIGYTQISKNEGEGGKGMAIAGIVCGSIGTISAIIFYMR